MSSRSFGYTYTLSGSLLTETYAGGRIVTTTYDPANRPNGVTANFGNTTYVNSVTYNSNDSLHVLALGATSAGVPIATQTTTLDLIRQLPNSIVVTTSAATPPLALSYWYCPTQVASCNSNNGNLMSAQIQTNGGLNVTQTYGYADGLNRLTSAAETGGTSEWSQTYSYDQWGNRIVNQGSYNPYPYATALTQFTNNQWLGSGAGYDAAGNQTALPLRQFGYDSENRLVTSVQPGMSAISYVYDGDGRRVQKIVGSATTTFVYDASGQLATEYSSNSTATTRTQYLISDTLGSTRLVLDGTGAVKERLDYLPFGDEIPAGVGGRSSDYSSDVYPSNPDIESQKFTGKERDAETGLDFMEARYFSSAQGRFTSPDEPLVDQSPYDPQSWNLYGYVRNNPLRYTDPTGRCSEAKGGYTDEGSGLFPGPCSGGQIGGTGAGKNSVTVGVGWDDARLFMLQRVGDQFTAHGVAQFASDAGKATGRLTGATDVAECLTSGITGSGCSKTGVAMAILPGLGLPGRTIRIIERVAGAIHLEVKGAKGTYEVIANISREGDTIILEGAHMQGSGAGQFGGKELLEEIREAAKQFGREQGAKEVVIQGGARTSGANPGHIPPPIRIKVQ